MSREVADILALTSKLSLLEQWQVVQSLLVQLQTESLVNKFEELSQTDDILNNLNRDQLERLSKAIEESEAGKTIPHDQIQAEVRKWLTK